MNILDRLGALALFKRMSFQDHKNYVGIRNPMLCLQGLGDLFFAQPTKL